MLDLHEGVAEEFRAAAGLGVRNDFDDEAETSRFTWVAHDLTRAIYRDAAYKATTTRIIRKLRDSKPKYVIVPVSVQQVVCPACGEPGEIREGVHGRIHHVGLGVKSTCRYPTSEKSIRIGISTAPWWKGLTNGETAVCEPNFSPAQVPVVV